MGVIVGAGACVGEPIWRSLMCRGNAVWATFLAVLLGVSGCHGLDPAHGDRVDDPSGDGRGQESAARDVTGEAGDDLDCGVAPAEAIARVSMAGCDGYWLDRSAAESLPSAAAVDRARPGPGSSRRRWELTRGEETLARWEVADGVSAHQVLHAAFDPSLGPLIWLSPQAVTEVGNADTEESVATAALLIDAAAIEASPSTRDTTPTQWRQPRRVRLWPDNAIELDGTLVAPPFIYRAYACDAQAGGDSQTGAPAGLTTSKGRRLALLLERSQSASRDESPDPLWGEGVVMAVEDDGSAQLAPISAETRNTCERLTGG